MGGPGSGYNGYRHLSVEECATFDADTWRLGKLVPKGRKMSHQGDWTYWDSQFVAWADITEDERGFHVFAEFTIIGRCLGNKWERKEKAGMVSLPSNLGHGERWYWVCPRCQRRCKSLYLRPDDFRPWCRRCHRLVNRSTQENRRIPGGIIGYLRADGIIEDHYDKVYKRWDKRNNYRRMKAGLLREIAEKSGEKSGENSGDPPGVM